MNHTVRHKCFIKCILTNGPFLPFLHSVMPHSLGLPSAPLFCDAGEKAFRNLSSCDVKSTNRLNSSQQCIPEFSKGLSLTAAVTFADLNHHLCNVVFMGWTK